MNIKPNILILSAKPMPKYEKALTKCGIDFTYSLFPDDVTKYDGLLIVGGGDILPAYYGKNIYAENVNFILDKIQFSTIEKFISAKLPILAVCRGAQLICVLLGGSLKNVNGHLSKDGHDVFHTVNGNGFLANLQIVNSCHHQAVDDLPLDFFINATSNNGVIEGFSSKNILAVQFHPERLNDMATDTVYGKFKSELKSRRTFLKRKIQIRRLT